ncbi:HAD family phosphatase [Pontibacter qinzhouensis]|uniref:HAD family phosphatase n=1 Tax=Pontibacter qinzhouensis TaxID=2603253 RepID=A0A5C8KBR0_9BACT|nr:Cof-type HAD-IIB family hydrolase [Pontibacter qinzhouensis]TXK47927.1 HAD family phosphatase [Pontibacter qinzhouensis]
MTYRAICTDIDGTLLDSRRELSPRTIAAFKKLDKSIPVILASSRMPSALRHLQRELGILDHPMICFNGGYVLIYEGNNLAPIVVDTVEIPVAICADILLRSRQTDIHVSLYVEDLWYAPQMDQWTEREERITKVSPTIAELESLLSGWQEANTGAHKVMCMGPENEISAMQEALEKTYGEQLHIYRSKDTYLEIAPRAISKASALEMILKDKFDIPMKDVVAFGDNYNDIEMLQAVGLGIAVGNARNEVKAVANEITLPNKEDGVAVAIEKHFLSK